MENAPDAIGMNPKIAQKLSGADFDGDTVIVIPNNKGLVKSSASLKSLENFDPIEAYRIPKGSNIPPIKPQTKQTKMGEVSNLITDMTIKGATLDELAKAVKHSMVVIDSEKHNLNYKQSYIDNGISSLAEKYQNSKRGGASTIIAKASSEIRVDHRKDGAYVDGVVSKTGNPSKLYIDPKTGKKLYTYTGESYVNKKGKVIKRTVTSTKMAETDDAYTLSSGRQIENVYASYANALKALGNTSRKTALETIPKPYSPSAKAVYSKEVAKLNASLNIALKNKPLERQAQIIANTIVDRKKQANPEMDADDIKKIRNAALSEARNRTGAKKTLIKITDREWEAIQAGAVSTSKLSQIIQNTDLNTIKSLASPRIKAAISPARLTRAKSMLSSGLTQAEVAEALGISTSTLSRSLK